MTTESRKSTKSVALDETEGGCNWKGPSLLRNLKCLDQHRSFVRETDEVFDRGHEIFFFFECTGTPEETVDRRCGDQVQQVGTWAWTVQGVVKLDVRKEGARPRKSFVFYYELPLFLYVLKVTLTLL